MMNWHILSAVLALTALVSAEQYTDRYDNINIDEILANPKLLVAYVKCVLNQGRCTPEGKELKAHIKDAMQTGCAKCTSKQKINSRKVVNHIKAHEVEFWEEIKKNYDPNNEFQDTYEEFLAREDE